MTAGAHGSTRLRYPVSCSGCYSRTLVTVMAGPRGRRWDFAEERRQIEQAGWSYLNDNYAICPGCAPAWAPDMAA